MAKPMLVTLPFVLLLLDFWPLNRLQILALPAGISAIAVQRELPGKKKKKSRQQPQKDPPQKKPTIKTRAVWPGIRFLLQEKIPLIVVSIVFCFVTIYAQHQVTKPMELYPLVDRIANTLTSYISYIGKMLWPVKLSIFYPYVTISLFSWKVIGAALLLIIITYLTIREARRFPYLIVGWLWYLGTLIPVIGLVQVGLQSMADRYTYVPLIGVFIMIAWGVPELINGWRYRRSTLAAAAGGVLLACMIMTYVQISFWRNGITLYEHATKVTTENEWAHYNLGLSLMRDERINDAFPHFQEAIRINPNDLEALLNLGVISAKRGDLDAATSIFVRLLQFKPDYSEAHVNFGLALMQKGNIDEGIAHIREAIRLKPSNPEYYFALGKILAKKGNLDEAIVHYSRALQIKPTYAEAHSNMGVTLARKGNLDEAIFHFRQALQIRPNYKEADNNLQVALAQQRKTR